MVKFEDLLGKEKIIIPINPIDIFNNLDKEIGKETLRDSQKAVLKEWYEKHHSQKDIIVKLHTGQGKTLIGLLLLQSSINEGNGPALYICPNNYLVDQIVKQARSFGIKTIHFNDKIRYPPREFLNSEAILVANCKKLFNGKSQFGVRGSRGDPINLGAIVIDDAHTCLDLIREQFSVIIEKEDNNNIHPIYERLWALFGDSLKDQASGTHDDISHGEDSRLAVPFWTWYDKRDEVLEVLSEYKESDELLFVWNLIKDHISECVCIFSGKKLEITPRLLPIDRIISYSDAKRRIFLSATLTEDAFLIKDMGISPESVLNPLSSGDVKYSGERLILLPSLVNTKIEREEVKDWIQNLAKKNGTFGVVALTPSKYRADQWESGGAEVTNVKNLYDRIENLKNKIIRKEAKNVLVLVNQYDGVDLPDSACRILTLDSLPSYNTLMDRFSLDMRPYSGIIRRKRAQRVEQGMGRAIRGSNDWCIIIITGIHLTNFLSNKAKRAFLSNEARLQIEIGEKLADKMKEEGGQLKDIEKLVNQCLRRDEGWKQFYKEKMTNLKPSTPHKAYVDQAIAERAAEKFYRQRQYAMAADTLQNILELADPNDKSWLMQLRATYLYPIDHGSAMDIQVKAHCENSMLFRPPSGITYTKVTSTGTRESRIINWIKEHESFNEILMELKEIMSKLLWGLPSDDFERGFNQLSHVLGFTSERPEKKAGRGPDNLWHIQGKKYWIIECKNQVHISRESISKRDATQLLGSIGWFKETHQTEECVPIIIHPAQQLETDAYIPEAFWVIGREQLEKLRNNTEKFYTSLTLIPFDELSTETIRRKLSENKLDTKDLMKEYLHKGMHAR